MPAGMLEAWFESGEPAVVNGIDLRPVEHPVLRGAPLSVQRGQAEAFFVKAVDGKWWIIKKFLPGRSPDRPYLEGVRSILHKQPGSKPERGVRSSPAPPCARAPSGITALT